MGEEGLRYDAMVEQALRSVVRRALTYAAERGLPGDHHFYVSFRTGDPGVDIPTHLRSRYPNEMTIVLQHQFWGLDVGEDAFGVTLSFSDVPERLTIPFAAISAFADPSVRFGLQFDASQVEDSGAVTPVPSAEQHTSPVRSVGSDPIVADAGRPVALPDNEEPGDKESGVKESGDKESGGTEPEDKESEDQDEAAGGGKVIMLDPYRKK